MFLLVFSVFQASIQGQWLILVRFLRKRSQQNPAFLFLAYLLTQFLSSCIPKSAVHAKGCHRVRLSVSNAAQASCQTMLGFQSLFCSSIFSFHYQYMPHQAFGLKAQLGLFEHFHTCVKGNVIHWQSSRQKSIFHNDK